MEKTTKNKSVDKKKFENLSKQLLLSGGDGRGISEKDRAFYLWHYTLDLGLNPASRPIEWYEKKNRSGAIIAVNLYANKTASQQLIEKNKISVSRTDRWEDNNNFYVEVEAKIGEQSVVNAGFCSKTGFLSEGNAQIAAYTKAVRRSVLSICGTGLLDETEVESMDYQDKNIVTKKRVENNTGDSQTGDIDNLIAGLEDNDGFQEYDDKNVDEKIEAITDDAMNVVGGACDFTDEGLSDVDFW